MKTIKIYQQELLETIRKNLRTISNEIEDAFLNTPRHLFANRIIKHNENKEIIQIDINDDNFDEYLPDFYADRPVGLVVNSDEQIISTISQPTIVLLMLDKLNIKQGQKILEIGTASGWNAALMAKLVGEKGHIHEQNSSMVIWKNDTLTGYGNNIAFDKIMTAFEQYLKFGMPDFTCFNLKVFPAEEQVETTKNSWLRNV